MTRSANCVSVYYHRAAKLAGRIGAFISEYLYKLLELIGYIGASPYVGFYKRNTLVPISEFVKASGDLKTKMKKLLDRKKSEAQYASVAGATMFLSVVSCLLWETLRDAHWTATAFFYCSVVLSISAVVVGAEHAVYISPVDEIACETLEDFQRLMTIDSTVKSKPVPKLWVLFAWQSPVMLLSYSMVTFLGGFCSVVFSPLAQAGRQEWGPQAYIAICVGIALVFCASSHFITARILYMLFEPAEPRCRRLPQLCRTQNRAHHDGGDSDITEHC